MSSTNDFFIKTLLTDKVKLQPQYLCKNVENVLYRILARKFEGTCSYHGYIKSGSIKISRISMGQIQAFSLNGDVVYTVTYHAEVCNPSIGSIVKAKVVNMNKFGILAECSIEINNRNVPILEIIIAKNTVEIVSEVDFEAIAIGQDIFVEILGKKYELNDKKISVVGKIIKTKDQKNILEDESGLDGGALAEVVDDEDVILLSDEESDGKESDDESNAAESDDEESEFYSDGGGDDDGSAVDDASEGVGEEDI